jgi:hypothetical protein
MVMPNIKITLKNQPLEILDVLEIFYLPQGQCLIAIIVIAFKGVIKKEYERQVVIRHPSKPSYPLEITLEKIGVN